MAGKIGTLYFKDGRTEEITSYDPGPEFGRYIFVTKVGHLYKKYYVDECGHYQSDLWFKYNRGKHVWEPCTRLIDRYEINSKYDVL